MRRRGAEPGSALTAGVAGVRRGAGVAVGGQVRGRRRRGVRVWGSELRGRKLKVGGRGPEKFATSAAVRDCARGPGRRGSGSRPYGPFPRSRPGVLGCGTHEPHLLWGERLVSWATFTTHLPTCISF